MSREESLDIAYSREVPIYDSHGQMLQCSVTAICRVEGREDSVYAVGTDLGVTLIKDDSNYVIFGLNRIWFTGRPVHAISYLP